MKIRTQKSAERVHDYALRNPFVSAGLLLLARAGALMPALTLKQVRHGKFTFTSLFSSSCFC